MSLEEETQNEEEEEEEEDLKWGVDAWSVIQA